jgi:hypothetical protein
MTRLCYVFATLSLLVLFSSCSISNNGTVPRGTPDHGNGTPAVIPSAQTNLQDVQSAPAGTAGASYAFVRKNQLWMAANGAAPAQVTSFNFAAEPNVFWHHPLWSPGDHYLAFIMSAYPAGLGGGGCPGPNFGANGALYVMNAATRGFAQVKLPVVVPGTQATGVPLADYWQYTFWEDATHLLAWYNGPVGKTSNAAGLYRYDLNTGTLRQVMPLSALGVATLFAPQDGVPLLLSLRYSSEQLFYQVVVHPFEQQSEIVIYRRSLQHPEMQSSQVAQIGGEAWCTMAQQGSFVTPGWDIAPDGEQLVTQSILAGGSAQGVSAIQTLNLNDGSVSPLFTQMPSALLGHDMTLTWGPDSQTVVAAQYHLLSQYGPYTASLADPAATRQYAPSLAGQAVWRTDSSAFVLQAFETADGTASDSVQTPDVYVFFTGDAHGRMLLADAHDFTWG